MTYNRRTLQLFWLLFFIGGCSNGSQLLQSATRLAGPWRIVGVHNENHSIMTAGFLNEQYVITGGVVGQMAYSSDGAETWLETDSLADCRYGLEIVSPALIWSCGGATHVRKSLDGGQSWQMATPFGDPRTITNPCHAMSFLDEKVGWLANWDLFGATVDGGLSWIMPPIPAGADGIVTIDTYFPAEGYLLDKGGRLFFTADNGLHWQEAGHIPLPGVEISFSAYQLAAMRFTDRAHGMVVVSTRTAGKPGGVIAFHTADGGQSWLFEVVPVGNGPVYLARGGDFLTVLTSVNQLTLLKYEP